MRNLFLLLFVLVGVLLACRKKSETPNTQLQNCTYVPTYIDTTINLNDLSLLSIRTKGYAFLRGGYRGVVVYKVSDTEYRAFDRVSTYKMTENGCQVLVDGTNFYMRDTCSGSKFDFEGNVLQGPAVCPLMQYQTSFVGSDRLRIYHAQ